MRRTVTIFLVLTYCHFASAQGYSDTLEVARNYKTILIFPENIAESIIGSEFGFIADLPKSTGSRYHRRILKLTYDELAREKEHFTNHTVITESGNVYDFILALKDRPKKMTWYISSEMSITNIAASSLDKVSNVQPNTGLLAEDNLLSASSNPQASTEKRQANSIHRATEELYRSDPLEYYRLRCYYMQFDKAKISRYFTRLDGLFLWLKGVYYNQDELYFQFRIENKEGLDMDINFIKHHIGTNYKNSSSNQRLPLEPVFVFKQPKTVAGKSENHFVIVFKKFALDEKKEVVVELDEESGNRNVSLTIGHEIINNPIHF